MIWQLRIFSSRMLKKAKARLLTRAVQNSSYVFARAYRTATVRAPVPNGPFQQCAKTFVLALALFSVAAAATVSGRVELVSSHDPNVRKHTDYSGVVVWLEPAVGTVVPASAARAQMVQKDKTFTPHVLAISVGTVVDFPNFDPIFHNAFSNYNGQVFDIGLYPPGTTKSLAFRREGVVRVFCNIHPTMSAVILVVKSPYFATSQKNGSFEIANVRAGSYRTHVFHERAAEPTLAALTQTIEVGGGPLELAPVQISESGYLELPHKNKFGKDYPPAADSGIYMGTKP
jgi:plastocyanin